MFFEPRLDDDESLLRLGDVPESNLQDRVVGQVAVPEAGVELSPQWLDALVEFADGDHAHVAVARRAPREDGMDGVVDVEQLVADFDSGAERDFRTAFYIGRVVLDAESNRQLLSVFDDVATEFDGGGVGERGVEQLH